MMLPPEPCLYIRCSTARVVRNAPSRWMLKSFFQSANLNSSSGATIWMPALLTSTSTFPNCSTVRATPASTCCSFVTSMTTPMASRAKVMAISLPMPLAAPVTMATLSLRRMSRNSRGGRFQRRLALRDGRLQVIVDDLAEAERDIANEVNRGHDLEHGQLRDRGQRVRRERKRRRARPRALERDVLEIIFDDLADPRAAVDVRNDLEQKVRGRERSADRVEIGGFVLVSHGGGGDADRPVVERADHLIDLDVERRLGELLGKAPKLAAARDRRLVV